MNTKNLTNLNTLKTFEKNYTSLQTLYYDVCSLEEKIKEAEKELLNKISKKTWVDSMFDEVEYE
jgi:hypothetical protein